MRQGGIAQIDEGKLKGRTLIIPSEVYVSKGTFPNGSTEYSKACLVHERFIPDQGCPDCQNELVEAQEKNRAIGL